MRSHVARTASVLLVVCSVGWLQAQTAKTPIDRRSYVWFGELVALNEGAKTATIKSPIPSNVANYVDRFKTGDRLVLVWDMIGKKQADQVLALWKYDDVKDARGGNTGFVLPIEFVSADAKSHTVTFNTRVPDAAVSALKAARPGQWIRVDAPMDQPSQEAAITSIQVAERPQTGSIDR